MLSDKQIECPNNLLKAAKNKKNIVAAIVNAGKPLPIHSAMEAVKENLIIPIFIGDKKEINKCAAQFNWDIFNKPKIRPKYSLGTNTWWIDKMKADTIDERKKSIQ